VAYRSQSCYENQNQKEIHPFPYRIHDTPDKEKLAPFVEFAKKYGHISIQKTPEGMRHLST